MGIIVRLLFLIGCLAGVTNNVIAAQESPDENVIAPGQHVPDFSLPAVNGWGQRLAEVKGQAVMLIWLDDCDQCEEQLAQYQLMAEGLQAEGLVTWFIWIPDDDDKPPYMRLPVLVADPYWKTAWQFESRPAVMLVNADGVLEHLILGDLDDNFIRTEQLLTTWLMQQQRLK